MPYQVFGKRIGLDELIGGGIILMIVILLLVGIAAQFNRVVDHNEATTVSQVDEQSQSKQVASIENDIFAVPEFPNNEAVFVEAVPLPLENDILSGEDAEKVVIVEPIVTSEPAKHVGSVTLLPAEVAKVQCINDVCVLVPGNKPVVQTQQQYYYPQQERYYDNRGPIRRFLFRR